MGLITQGGASVGRCALGFNISSLQNSGPRALDLSVEGLSRPVRSTLGRRSENRVEVKVSRILEKKLQ